MKDAATPPLGFGLGMRPAHYGALIEAADAGARKVDWLEIISENYIGVGGRPRAMLESMRSRYPLVMHGVGLSIASTDALDERYIAGLKELAARIEPRLVSDHLCWTRHGGANSHDLLPVAYTEATLAHVAARVEQVQERLGRRLYLENPSAYVAFAANEMGEAEFLANLSRRTGCGLLLDVNNLFVNACNLSLNPVGYLQVLRDLVAADPGAIGYFHLAGHTVQSQVRIDTHSDHVPDDVWALYRQSAASFPSVPTLIEWDERLPEFPVLLAELDKARAEHRLALSSPRAAAGGASRTASTAPAKTADAGDTSWHTLQDEFWRLMTARRSVAPGEPGVQRLVDGLPSPALVGINVYADAYHLRIADVASEIYPALVKVLGRGAFGHLVIAYLADHPPRDVSIKFSTSQLPGFLETSPLVAALGLAPRLLADLAALEQARDYAFDAPDDPAAIGIGVLEEIADEDWERVRFDFIQSLVVVPVAYGVDSVVEAVADGRSPDKPKPESLAYAVFRRDGDVECKRLSAEDGKALALLQSGLPFRDVVARMTSTDTDEIPVEDPELVERTVAALVRWVSWELVHGVRLSPGNAGDA